MPLSPKGGNGEERSEDAPISAAAEKMEKIIARNEKKTVI